MNKNEDKDDFLVQGFICAKCKKPSWSLEEDVAPDCCKFCQTPFYKPESNKYNYNDRG